jgi:protein NrfD
MRKHYWSWPIATYLFLGGLGGGIFTIIMICENFFEGGGFGIYCLGSAVVGLFCLAFGTFLLVFELGQPQVFLRVFTTKTAIIKWGAVLLSICIFAALFYILSYLSEIWSWLAWCSFLIPLRGGSLIVAGVMGTCIMIYTGVLLSSLKAHSFWATPALPILFTVSALSTACAAVALSLGIWPYSALPEFKLHVTDSLAAIATLHEFIHSLDIILIIVELFVLFIYLLLLRGAGNVVAQKVAARWLTGSFAGWFWGGMVVCGLGLPLLCYVVLGGIAGTYIAPIFALAGGLLLRFLVINSDDRRTILGEDLFYSRLPKGDEKFLTAWGAVAEKK